MRVSVLAGVLCFLLVSIGNADPASAAIRKPTNIPAEPLDLALKTLAKERQFQVLFRAELARDVRTGGAVGEFTPEEAIKQLLSGTGLSYKYLDPQTVTVFAQTSQTANPVPSGVTPHDGDELNKEAGKKSSQDFRVAQLDQGQTPSPPTVEKLDEKSSEKKKGEQLQEVVVTGSRIPLVTKEGPQPVQVYTQEQISASGQTTVADFLNLLPEVSIGSNESITSSNPGQTTVQLHGLPVGTTLVLLNGRRLESNLQGFFDLSNIPVSAVERIEILPVGASAIYGSDALGGAVNIVLRSDVDGFEVNGKYSHAADLYDDNLNGAWGRTWAQGSLSLLGSFQHRGELLGADRETTTTLTAPGPQVPTWITDYCSPGNIYSLNGANLPGLSSPQAAIPAGIAGRPTLGQFTATAGHQSLCNAEAADDLVPWTERGGLLLNAHYQLADAVDLFTETIFAHDSVRERYGPLVFGFGGAFGYTTLGAANPYNPFGETVGVSFADNDLLNTTQVNTDFLRPLVGARGTIHGDWHYEITASTSRDHTTVREPFLDSTSLQNALNSSSATTALNPFVTQAPTGVLLQSLLGAPIDNQFINQTTGGQAIVRGPLVQLPAGALQAVLGSEYRWEGLRENAQGGYVSSPVALNLHRISYAAFTEARVPIVSGTTRSPGDEGLALTLAGRYDHSSDYGGQATWQSGLQWRPTAGLLVRGGYSQSYEAPLLSQLAGGQSSGGTQFLGVADPFRGGQPITTALFFGSNPNVKPQTGDSRDLGIVYSGQQGFGASLTWYDIRIANFIYAPAYQTLVDYPQDFPGAVVRAPPTPQDIAQGYLGQILSINDTYYNFGGLRVSGVDGDLKYAFDTRLGELTPSIAVANVYRWLSAITPGAPAVSYLSQATVVGPGFAPRWKATGAIAWRRNFWSANLDARFVSRYKDYQDTIVNSNELGDFWIFDLNARYDIGRSGFNTGERSAGSYIAAGVINMMNRAPQGSYNLPWDWTQTDIRGRIVYVQIGVKWH